MANEPRFVPWSERQAIPDATVPFWAMHMLDLPVGSPMSRVRNHILVGQRPTDEHRWALSWYDEYEDLVKLLQNKHGTNADEWDEQIHKIVLTDPALASHLAHKSGPRGWVQWADFRDDNGERMVLKDFHVRTVQALRQMSLVLALLPFMHGKSALASGLVPFMDWSEQIESCQIRIYKVDEVATAWARTLMHTVEHHERLHEIWPGISKPQRGSINFKVWSTDGFNLAGRQLVTPHPSFRPLTWAQGQTGVRGDRSIFDDLVNSQNASSVKEQTRIIDYVKTGVMTYRAERPWTSKYGTKWGTVGGVGTIFHKQDLGAKLQREWRRKEGARVIRIDVFPYKKAKEDGVVIWPEKRPFSYIMELLDDLKEQAFNMRLRNIPGGNEGQVGFDSDDVDAACRPEWIFGNVPAGAPTIIGFDPASSKTTRWSKYPSFMVLSFIGGRTHLVAWGRWPGMLFPNQLAELAQLARYYQCPIAIEDNATQTGYAEQMAVTFPDVKTVCMTTTANKRDPRTGVELFSALFKNKALIIHAGSSLPSNLAALVSEWKDWPEGEFTDLVMATWIGKRQYDLQHKFREAEVESSPVPHYVRNRGLMGSIDLRPFKTAYANGQGSLPWKQGT